jgi:hypothetical protein
MAGKIVLSTRERRAWARKLLDAQEAVEAAEEARAQVMRDAFTSGMSYASIETSTGLGPQNVRNAINDAQRAGESQ